MLLPCEKQFTATSFQRTQRSPYTEQVLCLFLSLCIFRAIKLALADEPVAVIHIRGSAVSNDIPTAENLADRLKNYACVSPKGDPSVYVHKVVLELLFPADVVSAVDLSKTGKSRTNCMAAALFLGVFCSGICFVIQSVEQQFTTASHASLIFTLEPVFSAVFAYFLLSERLTVRGYFGAALMLVSLLIMELDVPALLKKDEKAP